MKMTPESLNQWFVLRGEDKYGPFEYQAMIRMLQKNELYDYNFVWAPHMDSWTLLGELEEFSKDRLARLIENNAAMRGAFVPRAHERIETDIPVYGHNGQLFFDGRAVSVSDNGALLLLNSPLLLPQSKIVLHFRAGEGSKMPAFNATATIVRKNFTRQRINVKSGLHYAVRFEDVAPVGREAIKEIIQKGSKIHKQAKEA